VFPQPTEPPQLPLQVSGRLAEPLEAGCDPVDRMQLHERIDELVGDPLALSVGGERPRDLLGDHLSLNPLHDVERGADHGGVLAHREHLGDPHRCPFERAQQPRFSQDIVGARGQRAARRPADDDPGGEDERDVGVPLADELGVEVVICVETLLA
jgi:hypothetical protein